jgi:hypothetical protein
MIPRSLGWLTLPSSARTAGVDSPFNPANKTSLRKAEFNSRIPRFRFRRQQLALNTRELRDVPRFWAPSLLLTPLHYRGDTANLLLGL